MTTKSLPNARPGDQVRSRAQDGDPWTASGHRSAESQSFAELLGLPEPLARLLLCRGLDTPEAARAFLQPSLDQLHAPHRMLGMDRAVMRLREALLAREPILIYGDYDVDGTVATVLLKTALERAAAFLNTAADVRYHIPHRLKEGYGMRESRLTAAAAEGVRLVVSVDTGIRAFAAAEEAERLGLDLIVTDHHLPDGAQGVPRALAVLNPNQPGCPYPFKELCGAAVSFKLAQALLETTAPDPETLQRVRSKTLPSFLKLLAIATIADAVSLTGENRVIAAVGLTELRQPAQPGLRALMDLAGIGAERAISATDVGFRLAPRINAAGRMDIGSDVVDMFLTRDAETARALAAKLHRLNEERRSTEAAALSEIELRLTALAAQPGGLPECLVLDDEGTAGPGWHRGVVGILASRVVDRTGRPALVLAHGEGEALGSGEALEAGDAHEPAADRASEAHGSGRSVPGFHLLDALTAVHAAWPEQPLFHRFGGHAHAVGFALPSANVPLLRERLQAYAARQARESPRADRLECDLEIRLADLTPLLLRSLERLGPFGHGNPEPLFLTRHVRLTAAPRVLKDKHLRLSVEDPDHGTRFSGVAWSRRTQWAELARSEGWAQGDSMDMAFRLRRNEHPDFGGWEMEIAALRRSLQPTENICDPQTA